MMPRPAFNLTETPLDTGVTLIEASAGTGKTFTIAGLFLRLILERNLSVREILVVTFTEAATEELRDRVRRTLADAAAAFQRGCSDDPVMAKLIAPHLPSRREMLARLDHALCGFDEAPIFTIHSFCQRTLKDRAFESGALFDTELMTDEENLFQDAADDYWRKRFYESGPLPVAFALKNRLQPEKFLPLLREHARHPLIKYVSRVDGRELDSLIGDLETAFAAARSSWVKSKDTIVALMNPAAGWAKGDHKKPEIFAEGVAQAAACFESSAPIPDSLAAIRFFSRREIREDTNAKSETPVHEFFELCDVIADRECDFLAGIKLDFVDFARAELPLRKRLLKAQSYGDLLTSLHAALDAAGGDSLVREVRAKYQAALIDEFQDTDPVQYQIFRRLFSEPAQNLKSETSGKHFLFLIGDPKQAIYGFRGADIFTYLDAAARVDQCFTLEQNWRSETPLVRAVNTVFGSAQSPFVFDEIHFQPVRAAGEADGKPLTEGGRTSPPLQLWFMPRKNDAKVISKGDAEADLPGRVAAEIARLLNGDTRLGNDKLTPRDIAVLVRKRGQAVLMQEALRALNIPSVLHTEESVFASREAGELVRVLAAIAQPGDERSVNAAFATDLMGVNGSQLEELARDEAGWQARLERIQALHQAWQQRGFTPMFREWLQTENVRPRVLAFADGERRLTNLLHLAEALHQAAQERRLGASELTRWLGERIADSGQAAEEHQLRLERDDTAVRLVTIHKSKGLEYPVVFCPFSWDSSSLKHGADEEILFHRHRERNGAISEFIRDLGSENIDEHRAIAFRERLAENLRLLYVALTRARNRCYLVWGGFKQAGTSAPAWLFHRPAGEAMDPKEVLDARFNSLDDAAMLRDLERLVAQSLDGDGRPSILLTPIPQQFPQPYRPDVDTEIALQPREFSGVIRRDWRIGSFSTLTAGRRDELPDYDPIEGAAPVPLAAETKPAGIFAFPRGTAPGTCLHKVFEGLDFTQADGAMEPFVEETLRTHGFDARQFAPGVCEAIRRTLLVPLDPARPGFTLSSVTRGDRLNELEFYFPVKPFTPGLLAGGFKQFAVAPGFAERLERLGFKPARGFIKGFIDLVFRFDGRFYIVDWKSNWLGNRAEDYDSARMAKEMSEKLYPLQYHLYAVALHQYLALRLPGYDYEKHFGGVFYLFVRGIDPSRPELGVYRDRPASKLIEQLSGLLLPDREGTEA